MDRDLLRLNVLRNALYHTARRRFFERINRFANFLVVLLGASAMASLASRIGLAPIVLGGLIATVGSVQLVFDFGGAARDHQALQRDYYHLLADIEEMTEAGESDFATFYARMIRIAGDEPPILKAIDAKAYNDAIDALETYPDGERLRIPWHHTLFGGFITFEGYRYRKLSEGQAG